MQSAALGSIFLGMVERVVPVIFPFTTVSLALPHTCSNVFLPVDMGAVPTRMSVSWASGWANM